jgi:ribonuclease T1
VSFSGRPPWWQALRKTGRWFFLAGAVVVAVSVQARGPVGGAVSLDQLPAEARATHQLILQGGPFPHAKDGSVFGNRERVLPAERRGYYHEYTVRTPGARDRGARRIVCGGKPPTNPAARFYTEDHYSTFRQIAQ